MSELSHNYQSCNRACPKITRRNAVIKNEAANIERDIAIEQRRKTSLFRIGEQMRLSAEIDQLTGQMTARSTAAEPLTIENVTVCPGPLEENIFGEGELENDVIAKERHCGAYLLALGIDIQDPKYQPVTSE